MGISREHPFGTQTRDGVGHLCVWLINQDPMGWTIAEGGALWTYEYKAHPVARSEHFERLQPRSSPSMCTIGRR